MDEFQFGDRARPPGRKRKPRHARRSFEPGLVWIVVAQTLHAERGGFPTDPASLAAADPSLTFLAGPSDGPTVVSYAAGQRGFAAAVRSESGRCWWVRIDVDGAISYGSGEACTGSAAMAASEPAW